MQAHCAAPRPVPIATTQLAWPEAVHSLLYIELAQLSPAALYSFFAAVLQGIRIALLRVLWRALRMQMLLYIQASLLSASCIDFIK